MEGRRLVPRPLQELAVQMTDKDGSSRGSESLSDSKCILLMGLDVGYKRKGSEG